MSAGDLGSSKEKVQCIWRAGCDGKANCQEAGCCLGVRSNRGEPPVPAAAPEPLPAASKELALPEPHFNRDAAIYELSPDQWTDVRLLVERLQRELSEAESELERRQAKIMRLSDEPCPAQYAGKPKEHARDIHYQLIEGFGLRDTPMANYAVRQMLESLATSHAQPPSLVDSVCAELRELGIPAEKNDHICGSPLASCDVDCMERAAQPQRAIPKMQIELPDGDSRSTKVWFTEWRGDDLHVCVELQQPSPPPRPALKDDEGLVCVVACRLAENDGNDDPHHLIWSGGAVPEPEGEVWQRYERDAVALLELIDHTRPAPPACALVAKHDEGYSQGFTDGRASQPPGEVPSYETIAEMLPSILSNGTTQCPLCGNTRVHEHRPSEIVIYRNGVKYGRSLHGGTPPEPAPQSIVCRKADIDDGACSTATKGVTHD